MRSMSPTVKTGRSRPVYDPTMMVALLVYAYSRGLRASRVIERACEEDVAFRVLAGPPAPAGTEASTRFMRRLLASEHGGGLYGQRQAVIEPVLANTKFNRGIDRFRRRRPSRRPHPMATDHHRP